MTRTIDVVGAAIIRDGRIFCVQRGPDQSLPGLWEFPGGKIEPGEAPADALAREIDEELDCGVRVGNLVIRTVHEYEFATIALSTFTCELTTGEPTLREHAASRWLAPAEMFDVVWAPADVPAVEKLITMTTQGIPDN
ncbi:(deoxy)nucleoside triphosphate pyrophosphohydrolase [Nocardioides okcheonensis]|uniref:(deoxy)nucleoside triphosphate pyrophosphohydrolase n=1 Tax=Nocardioides okcheonensis TaxID=2894081 RepID=UPI001E3E860E|nr:(deoxy)nucleoside triphosphate pyrophosphohydrolase [Nocardioides okcheonensis]UFN46434.1 (deoxy)nucleoside triphosphate pyrophosphohydrolase [Nocardioides okcheonensis]